MKNIIKITFCIVLNLLTGGLHAQYYKDGPNAVPFKSGNSVLFGKDIVINDQPSQNQRNAAVCVAFNGWLYAVYSHNAGGFANYSIIRSSDNGITWTVMYDVEGIFIDQKITAFDIIACGADLSHLKVFVASIRELDSIYHYSQLEVDRWDGVTGNFENIILHENQGNPIYNDIAFASDYMYPAMGSNPYSLGLVYSKHTGNDSVIFRSSSNGGISFDNKQILAVKSVHTGRVSLAYGICPSQNTGRYFAAWEEFDNSNSTAGHIYTSHSNPNFNSSFTTPVCLDCLDAPSVNKCRNPSIACQFNNVNNDSANLTEIVLCDRYLTSPGNFDVIGFYNPQAAGSSHFTKLTVANSAHNEIQPDINFDPFNNNFLVTYYDSTGQKLPYLINNFNLPNPDNWNVISTGYNDSTNLAAPHPKVEIDPDQQKAANIWIAERANGNGELMFDAEYSTYTGISRYHENEAAILYGAYPNPCNTFVNIAFELNKPEKVNVILYNLYGQKVANSSDQYFTSGKHELRVDVSSLSASTYIYNFKTGDFSASGKMTVVR